MRAVQVALGGRRLGRLVQLLAHGLLTVSVDDSFPLEREIMIINHTDCGMLRFTDSELEGRLRKETGRAPIAPAKFYSFTDAEENTKEQVQKARSHPWISPEVPVRGFVYDVSTGRLSEVFPDQETVTG